MMNKKLRALEEWYNEWEFTLRGWKFDTAMNDLKEIIDMCPCSESSRENCARCQDLPVWFFDNDDKLSQLKYVENSDIFVKDISLEPTDFTIVNKSLLKRVSESLKIAERFVDECNIYDLYENELIERKLIPERDEDDE